MLLAHQTRLRALTRFDLSQIPAGTEILSAWLITDWSWSSEPVTKHVQVYRLLVPFTDAATWIMRDATTAWATPGGDHASEEAAPAELVSSDENERTAWGAWDVTGVARRWYAGSEPNNGVLFLSTEDPKPEIPIQPVQMNNTRLLVTYRAPDVAAPGVDAAGDLVDLADDYSKGQDAPAVVVAADDDASGVAHVGVSEVGGAELAGVNVDCGTPRRCPLDDDEGFDVPLVGLAAGRHVLQATARDDAGKVGVSASWVIYIDRQAPGAPTDVASSQLDGEPAQLYWSGPEDPALPDGSPGSGTSDFSFRYRVNLGAWTDWQLTEDSGVDVSQAAVGDRIDVEIRSIDSVGNTGPVSAATVTVTANDGSASSEASGSLGTGSTAPLSAAADDPPGQNKSWIPLYCLALHNIAQTRFGNGRLDTRNAVRDYGRIRCWNNAVDEDEEAQVAAASHTYRICLQVPRPTPLVPVTVKCRTTTARAPRHPDPIYPRDTTIREPRGLCVAGNQKYAIESTVTAHGIRFVGPRQSVLVDDRALDCNEAGAWRYLASRGRGSASFQLGLNITAPRCHGEHCDALPGHGTSTTRRGWAAHHIVPGGEGRFRENNTTPEATRAQTNAYACGQLPNDPPNGAWLRGSDLRFPKPGYRDLRGDELDRPNHDNIHSIGYYQAVADRLAPFVNADDTCETVDGKPLVDELQQIKREVIAGTFPGLPGASKQP